MDKTNNKHLPGRDLARRWRRWPFLLEEQPWSFSLVEHSDTALRVVFGRYDDSPTTRYIRSDSSVSSSYKPSRLSGLSCRLSLILHRYAAVLVVYIGSTLNSQAKSSNGSSQNSTSTVAFLGSGPTRTVAAARMRPRSLDYDIMPMNGLAEELSSSMLMVAWVVCCALGMISLRRRIRRTGGICFAAR